MNFGAIFASHCDLPDGSIIIIILLNWFVLVIDSYDLELEASSSSMDFQGVYLSSKGYFL